jgi:hypothetical protein
MPRAIDDAHPAATQLTQDFIAIDGWEARLARNGRLAVVQLRQSSRGRRLWRDVRGP